MSGFLRLKDGCLVPVSSVVQIDPPDDDHECAVVGHDNEVLGYIHKSEAEALTREPARTIPATPGWRVVWYISQNDEFQYVSEPIVGWRIGDLYTFPITVGFKRNPNTSSFYVVAPDGSVVEDECIPWRDENMARAAIEERHRRKLAKLRPKVDAAVAAAKAEGRDPFQAMQDAIRQG